MNLNEVMDEIATRLDNAFTTRAFGYPPSALVSPPVSFVDYPEQINYDQTAVRGSDSMTLKVYVIPGGNDDRVLQRTLSAHLNGRGPSSVKEVLERNGYVSCDSVHVTEAMVDEVVIGSQSTWAAVFTLNIFGRGA